MVVFSQRCLTRAAYQCIFCRLQDDAVGIITVREYARTDRNMPVMRRYLNTRALHELARNELKESAIYHPLQEAPESATPLLSAGVKSAAMWTEGTSNKSRLRMRWHYVKKRFTPISVCPRMKLSYGITGILLLYASENRINGGPTPCQNR